MTDKTSFTTLINDDQWLANKRRNTPSAEHLQQAILKKTESLAQEKLELPNQKTRRPPFFWLALPASLAMGLMLVVTLPLFNLTEESEPKTAPLVEISDPDNEQDWQDYFLMEDDILLSSL